MGVAWGIVVVVLSLLCWGGQALSWFSPSQAANLSLTEDEENVEPVYYADIRGEALWDTFSLWTMVAAGVLLILDSPGWPYFGLIGGGMYLYFAGRGIVTRLAMQRHGFRIGTSQNITIGYVFLTVWGVMALVTAIAAVIALPNT